VDFQSCATTEFAAPKPFYLLCDLKHNGVTDLFVVHINIVICRLMKFAFKDECFFQKPVRSIIDGCSDERAAKRNPVRSNCQSVIIVLKNGVVGNDRERAVANLTAFERSEEPISLICSRIPR